MHGRQPAHRLINPGRLHSGPWKPGRAGRIVKTAAALSEKLGRRIPPSTLTAWLNGRSVAPYEVKIAVAEILGVPIESCWTDEYLMAQFAGGRGYELWNEQHPRTRKGETAAAQ